MNLPFLTRVCFLLTLATLLNPVRASDWPQWRGPRRDGVVPGVAAGPTSLPADPKPLWRKGIGGGFSSPVVSQGKLVYQDERDQKEFAHCLDAETGRELWNISYAPAYQDEWGAGPRSTPTIDADRVYLQSCDGEFLCVKMADGSTIWRISFEKDFGVKFLGSKAREGTATRRGNNGSPLIDGRGIIVPVGSPNGASLVCFDKMTGEIIWKTGSDEAAYSSPISATFGGVYQIVSLTADALMGVERNSGKILWRVPLITNAKRHAMTPVIYGDTIIVNSHTFGAISYRIRKEGDAFKATEVWRNKDLKINVSTPVLAGKHLFSQGPAKNLVCFKADDGELAWAHDGFGKEVSSVLLAGQTLIVLADDGQLVLVAANPEQYRELARVQVAGKNWNHPAYANGRLFVRDARELSCYDLLRK